MYRQDSLIAVAALVCVAAAGLYPGITNENHTCALSDPILSCSDKADPNKVDTCCTETFGGLVLLTQYWNTHTGLEDQNQLLPQRSWTIHGLWPDFCNGSYTQYCDLSRQYDPLPYPNTTTGTPDGTPVVPYDGEPISKWFEPNGKADLMEYMEKYWPGLDQASWILWAHEYSKHATCFSTFQTECYGPNMHVLDDLWDYFETTIAYFRTLPSWGWLATHGIIPSNSTPYTLGNIQEALTQGFGELPFVGCAGPRYNETEAGKGSMDSGRTELNEIWYYYHVFGAPQRAQGLRVPVIDSFVTTCAKAENAIKYYERAKGSEQ
ncbi:Ribonuclease Trv-like protein [Emericellopsis cladophorae]|uniref:ribonuclease T2 n=1 Tax=Emericellopsis cladophorae TaxID=2686198 RepID=A0A9Q0BI40_9HYPO|nr:Ribonuclease Trv-like protein [Emericellopsis cladophorae]KAI6785149.1 Ribonuclease Trv-like protein [Emericellopsis cladophorae]